MTLQVVEVGSLAYCAGVPTGTAMLEDEERYVYELKVVFELKSVKQQSDLFLQCS